MIYALRGWVNEARFFSVDAVRWVGEELRSG